MSVIVVKTVPQAFAVPELTPVDITVTRRLVEVTQTHDEGAGVSG